MLLIHKEVMTILTNKLGQKVTITFEVS